MSITSIESFNQYDRSSSTRERVCCTLLPYPTAVYVVIVLCILLNLLTALLVVCTHTPALQDVVELLFLIHDILSLASCVLFYVAIARKSMILALPRLIVIPLGIGVAITWVAHYNVHCDNHCKYTPMVSSLGTLYLLIQFVLFYFFGSAFLVVQRHARSEAHRIMCLAEKHNIPVSAVLHLEHLAVYHRHVSMFEKGRVRSDDDDDDDDDLSFD